MAMSNASLILLYTSSNIIDGGSESLSCAYRMVSWLEGEPVRLGQGQCSEERVREHLPSSGSRPGSDTDSHHRLLEQE